MLTSQMALLTMIANASGAEHQPKNLFDRLPAELRNAIYYEAVVLHGIDLAPFCNGPTYSPYPDWRRGPQALSELYRFRFYGQYTIRQPALTMASRQLREEVLSMFYSENSFVFDFNDPEQDRAFPKWLQSIGENKKWLRTIRLECDIMSFRVRGYTRDVDAANNTTLLLRRRDDGSVEVEHCDPDGFISEYRTCDCYANPKAAISVAVSTQTTPREESETQGNPLVDFCLRFQQLCRENRKYVAEFCNGLLSEEAEEDAVCKTCEKGRYLFCSMQEWYD
ncbi:hypothetical protein LTR36_000832 [Oleoguttula mirabilis]|uniref:Uncharacterized protein n=1 Tax=Oleoguttula mirabilis TaxID=1507867 RepID=A0AAV9J360_9PEZI|nr:hypothetical protein LTR36_000832 [Oleoguttula mirabilis]